MDPKPSGILDYRAQFFAPQKNFLGTLISTYAFNVLVIWMMTIILYISLYFEWLRKAIKLFEKVNLSSKVKLSEINSSKKK